MKRTNRSGEGEEEPCYVTPDLSYGQEVRDEWDETKKKKTSGEASHLEYVRRRIRRRVNGHFLLQQSRKQTRPLVELFVVAPSVSVKYRDRAKTSYRAVYFITALSATLCVNEVRFLFFLPFFFSFFLITNAPALEFDRPVLYFF